MSKENGLDRKAMISGATVRTVTITNIPRWGIDVTIRELGAGEQRALSEQAGDDDIKASQLLIETCVVSPKFTSEEVQMMFGEGISSEPVEYLLYGIRKLNRMTREEAKKIESSFPDTKR